MVNQDGEHVIAACDRPTVVYSSNKKLLFSNVNIGAVKHASPFNAAAYQHSMLLVSETTLTIGCGSKCTVAVLVAANVVQSNR